jgi:hypothetical protein
MESDSSYAQKIRGIGPIDALLLANASTSHSFLQILNAKEARYMRLKMLLKIHLH